MIYSDDTSNDKEIIGEPIDMSVVEIEDVYCKHSDVTDNSRSFFVVDKKLEDDKFLVNIWKRPRSFDIRTMMFVPSLYYARIIDTAILTKDELARDYFLIMRRRKESKEIATYEFLGL